MLKEIILLAVGAVFGLGATLMAGAAPFYFPNTPPWVLHAAFWGGCALMGLMVLDAGLLFLWRDTGPKLGPGVVINLAIAAIVGALIWHYSPANSSKEESLEGFTAFAFVRLYDTPEAKNRYIFDLGTTDGAKASFYLSASGLFTYSITDTHGSAYNLEIPVGASGIPIDGYVFLYCEAGVGEDATVMRVLINTKEVRRRKLDFPIDLGKKDWKQFTIGADNKGQNNAPFKIAMFGVGHQTFNRSQIGSLYLRFTQYLRDIGSGIKAGSK
jgi:hypothetical protein